jgi:hypothetical protein
MNIIDRTSVYATLMRKWMNTDKMVRTRIANAKAQDTKEMLTI